MKAGHQWKWGGDLILSGSFRIAAPPCQNLIEIGQGVEMLIGQRLVDHGPEMLSRLEFRGIGRQELEADAVGNLQVLGDMPAGAIENEHDDLVRSSPMSRANAARILLNIAVFTASA